MAAKMEIYDALGRLQIDWQIPASNTYQHTINIDQLSAGIYYLKVTGNRRTSDLQDICSSEIRIWNECRAINLCIHSVHFRFIRLNLLSAFPNQNHSLRYGLLTIGRKMARAQRKE